MHYAVAGPVIAILNLVYVLGAVGISIAVGFVAWTVGHDAGIRRGYEEARRRQLMEQEARRRMAPRLETPRPRGDRNHPAH